MDGWAYLVVSVHNAVYTLNAYRPTRRNPLLFGWSFFASWITIELAPFHLIWQIVVTTLFARRGALRTRQGKVGLAISLASWAAMLASIRQSFAAREEIRHALRDLEPSQRAQMPLPIVGERHIPFARAGGRTLRLDTFAPAVPAEPGTRRPALVQIHGGGWVIGFKDRQGQLLMKEMARRGWVCFNVDYRLSPMATYPDHLIDVKRALAWVRDHAEEYGIDPRFVAITGGSAGGHLTAMTALTQNEPEYQPGFEDADTSVSAAVPFYGVYDFTNRNGAAPDRMEQMLLAPYVMKADMAEAPEAYAKASPLDHTDAAAPPFLVIHGSMDLLAPVEDARDFVERLRASSDQPVYYLELAGAQHAFETFPSIRANAVVEAAARFLDGVYDAYLATPGDEPVPEVVEEAVAEHLGGELADELEEPVAPTPDPLEI